jgi:hypothetical protein
MRRKTYARAPTTKGPLPGHPELDKIKETGMHLLRERLAKIPNGSGA